MKYLLLFVSLVLVSACANQNRLSECEKWPLSAHCEDRATKVAKNEDGPVDPSPNDPEGNGENEEEPHPKHDNNGHGNGDEGDCKGRGCSDSDNPGGKK